MLENFGLDAIKNKITSSINSGVSRAEKAVSDTIKASIPVPTSYLSAERGQSPIGKYDVKQFSYPADLMSEEYGGNYAIFYINVSEETRLKLKEPTVELDPKTETRMRGSLIAKGMDVATLAAANAGTQILGGLGGGIAKTIKEGFDSAAAKKGAWETAVNSGGAALGVAVAGDMAPDASRSQRRLKTAIALHIPHQLSVRYGTQWSEVDTALLQGAADMSEAMMNGLNGKGANAKMGTGPAIAREGAAAIALNKVENAGAVSAALGIAANPKQEQTFKGVDFRKFTFDYQFFPRDVKEAQNVMNIIYQFKFHMHPEFKSNLNYVWIYPSEFDITYYTGGMENPHLHKHTSCVLEEMTVNYTPNGNFAVFSNGMPTQINVSLTFKELQILSKETVAGGL